jgi:hypothetical protein
MTTRNLAIRLSVTDAAKVKATLTDVGESGQRALKRIEDASAPTSRALLALDGAAGHALGSTEAMSGRLGTLGAALTRLGPAPALPPARRWRRWAQGWCMASRTLPKPSALIGGSRRC